MKKLSFITMALIVLASCTNNDENIPKHHKGEFRLESTQAIFFDGYGTGAYSPALYDQDCEELVIFFITEDSIGISPASTCGVDDYSLFRWAYDKINVEDIPDSYIKSKYEQIPDLSYVIRYYPDASISDQWRGYFGMYDHSDVNIRMINYDITILHMSPY